MSKKIKLFVLDLDGVLWLGSNIIEPAHEMVSYLQEKYEVVFFSNTSSVLSEDVCNKLKNFNFKCDIDHVYTSSTMTIEFLKENDIDCLYVIGSEKFKNKLILKKFHVEDCAENASNLVVGLDQNFNFFMLNEAFYVLHNNPGNFIVCNEDVCFPIDSNRYMAGCGAIVSAIKTATGKKPDCVVGKPNTYTLKKISKKFNVTNEEIVVIGDSYESDITMALNYKCNSILVGKKVFERKCKCVKDNFELLKYIKEIY